MRRPPEGAAASTVYPSVRAAIEAASTLPVIAAPGFPVIIGPHVTAGGPCLRCLRRALEDAGHAPARGGRPPILPAWIRAVLPDLQRAAAAGPLGTVLLVTPDARVRRVVLSPGTCGRCGARGTSWRPDEQHPLTRGPLPELPLDELTNDVLGPLLNVATHPSLEGPDVVATAQLAAYRAGQRVYGVGRATHAAQARTVAALEALERYGGLSNRSGAERRETTLAALGSSGLDPRALGLYRPAQYRRRGFPCVPFHPDVPRVWVEGVAVTRGQPVWVEESLVYYDAERPQPLVLNNSNGCALGATREEALVHGVLELIERDAAHRWWRAGSLAPELSLDALPAREADVLAYWEQRGFRVRAFDTTRVGVPSVVLVGTHTGGPRGFTAGCASAAAFHMTGAVDKALSELSAVLGATEQRSDAESYRALRLARHPQHVQTIDDHLLACTGELARRRFAPSLVCGPRRAPTARAAVRSLGDLIDLLARQGLEVIAVDQTASLHRRYGLRCVRAFVPGLLPLTYGAGNERLDPAGHPWPRRAPHPFS